MRAIEGEILKNKITNDLHMITKIDATRVILENGIGSVWISLNKKDLKIYYQKIKKGHVHRYV